MVQIQQLFPVTSKQAKNNDARFTSKNLTNSTSQKATISGFWQRSEAVKAAFRSLKIESSPSDGFQEVLESPYFALCAADHPDSCDTVTSILGVRSGLLSGSSMTRALRHCVGLHFVAAAQCERSPRDPHVRFKMVSQDQPLLRLTCW
jgi:hypothetical protein